MKKVSKFVVWLAKILSCDKSEPYLQRGEVLIRYETLYFQPRKNSRNICDVTSSNSHLGMLHIKNNFSPLNHSLGL